MKLLLLLLIPCMAFAGTDAINYNTADGKVKLSGYGAGTLDKPYNFCNVAVAGIPFLSLADAPSTYVGQAGKVVKVNGAENGLEFGTGGGGGGGVSITGTLPIIVTPNPITGTGVISLATATPTATATSTATPTPTATATPSATALQTFRTFSVSGQSDIIADQTDDTFTVVAGNQIVATTNASTDTLTIAVATATPTATFTPTATATATPTPSATATAFPQGFTAHFYRGGAAIQANDVTITPWTTRYPGTITGFIISADQGTATLKVWKKATGTAIPTIADVINTSGVSLATGTHIDSTTVTDFTTTTVSVGDQFMAQVTAVSGGATDITFQIPIRQ